MDLPSFFFVVVVTPPPTPYFGFGYVSCGSFRRHVNTIPKKQNKKQKQNAQRIDFLTFTAATYSISSSIFVVAAVAVVVSSLEILDGHIKNPALKTGAPI